MRRVAAIVFMLVTAAWSASAFIPVAYAQVVPEEQEVRAALLPKLFQFIRWPTPLEEQRLCVFGDPAFAEVLATAVDIYNQNAGQRVHVHQIQGVSEAGGCHVLYVGPASNAAVEALLKELGPHPVVTVSTLRDFASHGGAIELLREADRVRFVINLKAIQGKDIDFNAQLLRLAKRVIGEPR